MKDRDYEVIRKGASEIAILCLLEEQDMYGYEIRKEISERSGGLYAIPEGTMYVFIYRLAENGYISESKKLVGKRRTRVYYHLLPKGKEYLDELYERFMDLLKGINLFYENTKHEGGELSE